MSASTLARGLAPGSVAVIGASPTPGKAGHALMASLSDFPGPVYPIHPRAEEVLGRRAYGELDALPGVPDLALLAVPAAAVPGLIRACGVAGVAVAVVHAGGFAETGVDGAALQARVSEAARDTGIRVLGPNTSGFLAPSLKLRATFVRSAAAIAAGSLAIVAQSGGVNHALAFAAHADGLGVRLAVGLGNAVDVGFSDVLDHLADDPEVGAVALAIEGVSDGRRLVEAVERVSESIPVVALKVGRSDIAAFAQSHTGALTGSWTVTRAALRQAGAVVVDDSTQLIDAARALSLTRLPPIRSPGVGLITGQAGPGLMLADALGVSGVPLPQLPSDTEAELASLLGSLTFLRNPVDTGRPGPSFNGVTRVVSAVPGIDALAIYLLDEPDAIDPSASLPAAASAAEIPIVLGTAGPDDAIAILRRRLAEHGIPVFSTPERTANAVAALFSDARGRERRRVGEADADTPVSLAREAVAGDWDEYRAKQLLATTGIAVPRGHVCVGHDDALAGAAAIGFPVVAKRLHPALQHKTEAGAVCVGLRDAVQLEAALKQLDAIPVDGEARYLVEAMAPAGPELLLGGRRDPAFGALVVLGAGGVDAEIHADVSIRLAPVSAPEAATMLDELTTADRYRGHRGGPRVNPDQLAQTIARLSALIAGRDDIDEIEINPLRVCADGTMLALDALVVGAVAAPEAVAEPPRASDANGPTGAAALPDSYRTPILIKTLCVLHRTYAGHRLFVRRPCVDGKPMKGGATTMQDTNASVVGLSAGAGAVQITRLEAIPFTLAYRREPRFASGRVSRADNVLVRVHTDAGLLGQAEAQPRPYTYGETQTSIVHTVAGPLNDVLTGVDPVRLEIVAARCATVRENYVARGAVNLAVWDLVGQILGCSCHRLLGGFSADVAAAHMISFGEPAEMAAEAVSMHERLGVATFKIKVGRAPALDVAAVRAVREALPSSDLYVDANRGWSYDDAIRAGDELAELGVRAIEEPISTEDRIGRQRLAARWKVPLGGDESCISLAHVEREVKDGAVGLVSIKTARTGLTESRRILDLCLSSSLPAVVGSQYEGAIGSLATIAFAAAFAATADQPAEITNFLDLDDDLIVTSPDIRGGRVRVADAPGLGVDVAEDRLERYRLDR